MNHQDFKMNKQFKFFKLTLCPLLFLVVFLVPNKGFSQAEKKSEVALLLNPPSLIAQKAYLQTDKPNYMLGDTLWFKSYVWNGNYLNNPLAKEVLYLDIVNETGGLIKRQIVFQYYGMGIGSIDLT